MIEIRLKAVGEKIATHYDHSNIRYKEAAIIIAELERIKKWLLDIEFEADLLIEENREGEENVEES